MIGAAKILSVVVMVVVPGALVVAAAWVLARMLAHQFRLQQQQGPGGLRLAKAVAAVRWRDVVRETRSLVRSNG